jgi:hypothetical protein
MITYHVLLVTIAAHEVVFAAPRNYVYRTRFDCCPIEDTMPMVLWIRSGIKNPNPRCICNSS